MKTLILIHGGMGHAKDMRPIVDAIGGRAHCVGLNLLGHGKCAVPDQLTMDGLVDDMAATIVKSGIKRPYLLAYCMSGLLVLDLLIRYPGLVGGVILLGPRYHYDDAYMSYARHVSSEEWVLRKPVLEAGYVESHGQNWPVLLARFRDFLETLAAKHPIDPADLARIDVPVLIVGPTRDQITTLGEAQFLAKHMPGSQLVVYEGSLHPFSAIALGPLANITLNFMR